MRILFSWHTYTHARARAHAHTNARTHPRTRTHEHTHAPTRTTTTTTIAHHPTTTFVKFVRIRQHEPPNLKHEPAVLCHGKTPSECKKEGATSSPAWISCPLLKRRKATRPPEPETDSQSFLRTKRGNTRPLYSVKGSRITSTHRKGILLPSKEILSLFQRRKGHLPTRATHRLTQFLFTQQRGLPALAAVYRKYNKGHPPRPKGYPDPFGEEGRATPTSTRDILMILVTKKRGLLPLTDTLRKWMAHPPNTNGVCLVFMGWRIIPCCCDRHFL